MNLMSIKKWCKVISGILVLAGLSVLPVGCKSDDIEEGAMYTFTGQTIASFCEETPNLSMYYSLLERSGNVSLLNVYGHYTCFAPTNEAVQAFLDKHGATLETLSDDLLEKLVYNSLIRSESTAYLTDDFPDGALGQVSMADRTVNVSFTTAEDNTREIWINSQSKIVSANNEVHNGVVHVVNAVIEPTDLTLLEVMQQYPEFSIWAEAYEATGLDKDMEDMYDDSYVNPYPDGCLYYNYPNWAPFKAPDKLKLGYTIFAETNEVLGKAGINSLETMEKYASKYYGTADLGNYESENNPLHKFIAYHMIDRRLETNEFLYSGTLTTTEWASENCEYYETFLPYHIIMVQAPASGASTGNRINLKSDGSFVSYSSARGWYNIAARNGVIHALTNMLVYDENVMKNDVLHKRIRFDFFACAPHFVNNGMRWTLTDLGGKYGGYTVTPDFCGKYFTYNDAGVCLLWASTGWSAYQEDEINMKESFDFTVRLIPVPPGEYELRIGYRAEGWRGMSQLFVDGAIAGTPVDLRIGNNADDPRVGWQKDDETNDDGVENDKLMRNHGYMKAPESIWCWQNNGTTLRDMYQALRIIVGRYDWRSGYGEHYLRVRSVDFSGREFSCDYIELIPVDLIKDEDRG